MDSLNRTLTTLGSTMDSVTKTTIYMTNITEFARMNPVYVSYFTPNSTLPARSTVQVTLLFSLQITRPTLSRWLKFHLHLVHAHAHLWHQYKPWENWGCQSLFAHSEIPDTNIWHFLSTGHLFQETSQRKDANTHSACRFRAW